MKDIVLGVGLVPTAETCLLGRLGGDGQPCNVRASVPQHAGAVAEWMALTLVDQWPRPPFPASLTPQPEPARLTQLVRAMLAPKAYARLTAMVPESDLAACFLDDAVTVGAALFALLCSWSPQESELFPRGHLSGYMNAIRPWRHTGDPHQCEPLRLSWPAVGSVADNSFPSRAVCGPTRTWYLSTEPLPSERKSSAHAETKPLETRSEEKKTSSPPPPPPPLPSPLQPKIHEEEEEEEEEGSRADPVVRESDGDWQKVVAGEPIAVRHKEVILYRRPAWYGAPVAQ